MADSIEGVGSLTARGGFGASGGGAGGGGGGVIWVAAKSYDGLLTASVSGGNGAGGANGCAAAAGLDGSSGKARIYQIRSTHELVRRDFSDSW